MKKRPILFHKNASHQGNGREVIGLIGTHRGVGVTYTGLMLAFYMAQERGKRTAYLECNEHGDMALIQKAYEWSYERGNSFSFQRVTCYKEVAQEQIAAIFNEDYNCIILDFGADYHHNKEELLRCSSKIVLGGRSGWDLLKLTYFIKETASLPSSDTWLYFIPQVSDKTIRNIKQEVERRVLSVPYIEEPTMPSNQINHFFAKVF